MARQARVVSDSGIYHVILRGVNRMRIFVDEADYLYLLDRMHQMTEHAEIFAFCLMSNHIHILMREVEEPIGMVMKRVTSSYVYYFNHKYGRVGHLFQERFKSQPVEDDEYFVTLLRYIHQNPVKAGMVASAENYRWSSWHELMGDGELPFCNRQYVLNMITREELRNLVLTPLDDVKVSGILDYEDQDADEESFLKLDRLQELMLEICGCRNAEEFSCLPKSRQQDFVGEMVYEGAGIRDLSVLTGIPKSTVHRIATKWKEKYGPSSMIVADDSDVEDYPDY